MLYLITKLQNLKAIHNFLYMTKYQFLLYLITKLQNLKAIHNVLRCETRCGFVVSNYKITKSESYSQRNLSHCFFKKVVSNYKITKSESYSQQYAAKDNINYGCI